MALPKKATRGPGPASSGNRIVASLPWREQAHLARAMDLLRFDAGEHLAEPGLRMQRVFFPLSGVVGLVTTLSGGTGVEIAMVGREGMVGVPVFLGGDSWPNVRVVQLIEGESLALRAETFLEHLRHSPALRRAMDVHARALLAQAAQEVACNRLHPIGARFSRWLLVVRDLVEADTFPLTQETMAELLGVRRPSITLAATGLQRAGAIRYRRGTIRVLDARVLERRACECYRVLRAIRGDLEDLTA